MKTRLLLPYKAVNVLMYGSLHASTISDSGRRPVNHQESLFLLSRCFATLVQRIFNRDKIQDIGLAPDNALNALTYRSPFCVIM